MLLLDGVGRMPGTCVVMFQTLRGRGPACAIFGESLRHFEAQNCRFQGGIVSIVPAQERSWHGITTKMILTAIGKLHYKGH